MYTQSVETSTWKLPSCRLVTWVLSDSSASAVQIPLNVKGAGLESTQASGRLDVRVGCVLGVG